MCGAACRRWCRSAGGGSRPLKATVPPLYPPLAPALPRLSTCRQTRWVGRGGFGGPTLRKMLGWGATGLLGHFRAAGSVRRSPLPVWLVVLVSVVLGESCDGRMTSGTQVLERLSPSRGKPNGVAPPVGLSIVGRLSLPAKSVTACRRCAERPTPLCWRRSADPSWPLVGSSGDGDLFRKLNPVLSQRGGRSPRIGKAEAKPGLSRCPTRSGGSLRWSLLDR